MRYLLDTNIVSETRRRQPDANVMRWLAGADVGRLHVSVLVLGEIRRGVELLRGRDPQQADGYERWLMTLADGYASRVLPVTPEVADAWGRLNVPDQLPVADGLMLATAQVHGLTFATRNVRDVANSGVPVVNPFAS
ncbi:MAG: type II toxin-antitoxin system VapC family toxin [Candidatus Dormibacteria bacterium]